MIAILNGMPVWAMVAVIAAIVIGLAGGVVAGRWQDRRVGR